MRKAHPTNNLEQPRDGHRGERLVECRLGGLQCAVRPLNRLLDEGVNDSLKVQSLRWCVLQHIHANGLGGLDARELPGKVVGKGALGRRHTAHDGLHAVKLPARTRGRDVWQKVGADLNQRHRHAHVELGEKCRGWRRRWRRRRWRRRWRRR